METIRDQIKDACINNGVDLETACNIADELDLDDDLGDLTVSLTDLLIAHKKKENII